MKKAIHLSALFLGCISLGACSSLNSSRLASLSTNILNNSGIDTPNIASDHSTNIGNTVKGLTISDKEIKEIAKDYIVASDKEHEIAPSSNAYSKRLNKLVKNHIKEDGLELDFKVYLSPEMNAFSLANGSIRVYSGLMDLLKDDELLSVIGHEIGHIKLGHSKSQLQKAYITSAGVGAVAGELSGNYGATGYGLSGVGINAASDGVKEIIQAQFSQSDEIDADDYGFQFLKNHSYNQDSAIRALKKISEVSEAEGSPLAFLTASHPDPESRAKRLQEQLSKKTVIADKSKPIKSESKSKSKEEKIAKINDKDGLNKQLPPKQSSNSHSWYIQVAALEEEVEAREMLSNIVETGMKGAVQDAYVKGKTYFRVLVGPYRNKEMANEDLERITNLGFKHGKPFVKNF